MDKTKPIDKKTLDEDIGVAPPAPEQGQAPPDVRPAHDASDDRRLKRDPSNPGAKLDIELDESFPSSDPPSSTRPGAGDPAPSSGYDEAAEKRRKSAS